MSVIAPTQNGLAMNVIAKKSLTEEAGIRAESSLQQKARILKGRNVGVTDVGGSSGDLVRFVLSEAGFSEENVNLVQIPSNAGLLSALKEGKVDAIASLSPTTDKAVVEGFGFPLVVPMRGDLPTKFGAEDFAYVVMMSNDKWVETDPDKAVKFLRAHQRALDLAEKNPPKAKAAFYQYVSSLGAGNEVGKRVQDAAFQANVDGIPSEIVPKRKPVQDSLEFFGIADKTSAKDIINLKPAKKAMAG